MADFTFIDLFAGIGGIRLGFEAIGGRCVFTSEWNEWCKKTYTANFGEGEMFIGDIVPFPADQVPDHDVLLAGFPCQPFSVAGVTKNNALGRLHGFENATQGTLFYHVARIIAAKQPKAFMLENVKNLVSHDRGRTFAVIRHTLETELGYQIFWKVIDGQAWVPQHRERIIIVGFKDPTAFSWDDLVIPDVHPKLDSILHPEDGTEAAEPPFTTGRMAKVNPKYVLTDKLWQYLQNYAAKHRAMGNGFGFGLVTGDDVARTLSARYYKDGSEILVSRGPRRTPRRLTPRECARLMGFDDTYQIVVSDTQAYRQFGNTVVVPVIKAIAQTMEPYIQDAVTQTSKQVVKKEGSPLKQGALSDYFIGVASKVIRSVEANVSASNQHEYNGVTSLKQIFGTEKSTYQAQFIYLRDSDEPITGQGRLTWYDARKNHSTRTEYRMYFSTSAVSSYTMEGDILFLGLRPDHTVLVIIAEADSTISNQLYWLFGLEPSKRLSVRDELNTERDQLAFISQFILEQIGITTQSEPSEDLFLKDMVSRFGNQFPSTREFSEYARSTLPNTDPSGDPDVILMQWIEREESLFRIFEKHLISERLSQGFDGDVPAFLQFSLSVQNRRKSRAGQALENHVEQLLLCRGIRYERTAITENRSRPDFLFPGSAAYHNPKFDRKLLTMLGVKSTCKDRWRQVLSEASEIPQKHLLTLEAAISENQTHEMQAQNLQLVVPKPLHSTYSPQQQKWLMSVAEFIELVQKNQRIATLRETT